MSLERPFAGKLTIRFTALSNLRVGVKVAANERKADGDPGTNAFLVAQVCERPVLDTAITTLETATILQGLPIKVTLYCWDSGQAKVSL